MDVTKTLKVITDYCISVNMIWQTIMYKKVFFIYSYYLLIRFRNPGNARFM
jgi:hypothetical protein